MHIRTCQRPIRALLALAALLGLAAAIAPRAAYAQTQSCGTTRGQTPCPPEDRATPPDGRMNAGRPADPYILYCVTGQLQIYKVNAQARGEFYTQTLLTLLKQMNPASSKVTLAKGFTVGRNYDNLTVSGPDLFQSEFSLNTCLQRGGGLTAADSQPDFNRDGIADIVTIAPVGIAPCVKVMDGRTGNVLLDFAPYEPTFKGGIRVTVGDLNGDGIPDIVTVPGAGMAVNVRVFDGRDAQMLASFFAFEPSFKGGATVLISNVNGDAQNDIVVRARIEGRTQIKAFDGKSLALLQSRIE